MIVRKPRPKLYPRPKQLEQEEIVKTFVDIQPALMREASKIYKPAYISDKDLVQEAYVKILKYINTYDSTKASFKHWCITVAKNNFYTVTLGAFRKDYKYSPDNKPKHVSIDDCYDHISPTTQYHPFSNNVDWDIRYKELIERTRIKLKPFAREVFEALLEPPEELIEQVKRNRIQKLREKRTGSTKNIPFEFIARNQHLADHFRVEYKTIVKSKSEISKALEKAIEE